MADPRPKLSVLASTCLLAACSSSLGPSAETEEGFFLSGSDRLSYAMDIPRIGSAPYPTVVFGHDSGANTKNENKDWARRLVANGIAVLRFDKRGVGDSDGVYIRGRANFDLLASDLVAAVEFVARDARVDPSRIGLMGASQAGWILPIVATRAPEVAYTILLSGPAVTVAEHNFWDATADDGRLSISELSALLADFERPTGDFDPRPFLEQMTIPGLWLLGDQDRIIPTRETAAIVRDLAEGSGKPFSAVVYPDADHGLRNVQTGDRIDFWVDLLPWLRSIVG